MATTQKHLDKVEMEENKKEQGVVMNEQQIKLRELCSNSETSIKEVSNYYSNNNDRFDAVDDLRCMKYIVNSTHYFVSQCMKNYDEVQLKAGETLSKELPEAQQGVQKDTDMKNSSNPRLFRFFDKKRY
mgnify:CR=1 FL=1